MLEIKFIIEGGELKRYIGHDTHVVIPNNVTYIAPNAFKDGKNIESVEIPNSVGFIDYNAFRDCTSLRDVIIPNSVKIIGSGAFSVCSSLENINLPNSIISIRSNAFEFCTNLKSIKIPNNVFKIGSEAFSHCYNLSHIEIPNSVESISFDAFGKIKNVKPQYNANGSLRAFKAFYGDWTCRDFQYAVGKSYHQDGIIQVCGNGFHACPNPLNVFNFYCGELSKLHFAEVELSGVIQWGDDKVAASDIKIVRELSLTELAEIFNSMEKE